MRNTRCRRLEELDFSSTPPGQTRQRAVIALVPPRQLLRSHSIGAIALVQPFDQGRASRIAAAYIERPADQSTVLVRVEFDRVLDVLGDALASSLEIKQVLACGCKVYHKGVQRQINLRLGRAAEA